MNDYVDLDRIYEELDSKTHTLEELKAIVAKASVDTGVDGLNLFYSGRMVEGNSTGTANISEHLADHPNIANIEKTDAYKVLLSDEFRNSYAKTIESMCFQAFIDEQGTRFTPEAANILFG